MAQTHKGKTPLGGFSSGDRVVSFTLQLQVYEALLRPFGGKIPKRVKTQVAAAAELGDVQAMSVP